MLFVLLYALKTALVNKKLGSFSISKHDINKLFSQGRRRGEPLLLTLIWCGVAHGQYLRTFHCPIAIRPQ